MIARYSRPEMSSIFSEEMTIKLWLLIEERLAAVQTRDGVIPKPRGARLVKKLEAIRKKEQYSIKRFREFEQQTKHEFLAFLEMVAELVDRDGKNDSAYLHLGATSSDVLDTALMLQIQAALAQLTTHFETLLPLLRARSDEFQTLVTVGRTHGMFAEPTSFGLKFLSWYTEGKRNADRLLQALAEASVGKVSGAVGNNSWVTVAQEEKILEELGLEREPVSTQVIPRDRIAFIVTQLALTGAWIERACTEIRHLQRSEVGEVHEGFSTGQKGSSAMPHKKNPISCENLAGCARLLRTSVNAAFENCNLWHERDISHSSVERISLPDGFILLDYMLARFEGVIKNLQVDKLRVSRNRILAGDAVLSGKLLTQLGLLGVPRVKAYGWVQRAAFHLVKNGGTLRKSFEAVLSHRDLKKLEKLDWGRITDDRTPLKEVKKIYGKIRK